MRLPRRHSGRQRENRLSPVQRLHLTLFVYTQDDRAIRRIHVQSDDIPHLFNKLRIFGELEVLHPVRLQPEGVPDSYDRGLR